MVKKDEGVLVATLDKGIAEQVEQFYRVVFLSSRRRHTRYWRDWSSDVCSSDLTPLRAAGRRIDIPASSRRRNEHGPCGRAGLAHRPPCPADRVRVARRLNAQKGISVEIGRASCRERVQISVVAVSLKKKTIEYD